MSAPERGAVVKRSFVGQVQAHRHVEIRSRAPGVLEAMEVDEGAAVSAGQVLFRLRSPTAHLERERAAATRASVTAELEAARIELTNLEMLEERGVGSRAELELAKARLAMAAAKLDEAKTAERQAVVNADLAVIRAPFTGTVGRLPLKIGSVIQAEQLITTLTDSSEALVYFRVPEREYLELTTGDTSPEGRPVRFVLANDVELEGEGLIDAVDSVIERETGTVTFRARFDNVGGVLKHGATGTVVLAEEVDDALVIPQRATFEQQHLVYVYTVDDVGLVKARRVTPRLRVDDRFVLESGLSANDKIVLEGVQHLKDGARITIRHES